MAGVVPSYLTLEGSVVGLTDVSAGGKIIVEAIRIDNSWYIGGHHAS
jgi:hypothetical protein